MADAVVSSLLNQLSTFLLEEGRLLGGLRQEVEHINDELGHMRAFLSMAEVKDEDDPRIKEWITQVREAAFDAEDILDEFLLRFARHPANGFSGYARKIFNSIKNFRTHRRIASQIQSIKKRITNISEGHLRYQSEYGTSDQALRFVDRSNMVRYNKDDALLAEEANLVGIDEPKKYLISHLLDGDSQLKIVSVVGMGGLGKTTLVKRVHEDSNVRRQFQIRAWLTVSQTCDIEGLLKDLIQQLHEEMKKPVPHQVESMKGERLKAFIKELLQEKRYVIVFDDVWEIDFWSVIKFALPEGCLGNRVMLTTRRVDVAATSCMEFHGYIYNMKPLSSEDSWTLFCKKTFKDDCCPDYLVDVAQRILKKCDGLPLAIAAISGILAVKDKSKIHEWEIVRRSLGVELEGSGKLDRVKKILSVSYNELPYYLKTCLLYIGIFPEDYKIEVVGLIRLWISEGFVHETEEMTREEIAGLYLDELINRSLIQVADDAWDERGAMSCRIHDLLREIILMKSREQNMMTIATGHNTRWPEKIRRLAIHKSFSVTAQDRKCFKHARSFILFESIELLPDSNVYKLLFGSSRRIKVLDLRGAKQLQHIPAEVFELFYLKYLYLAGTGVKTVPKAIGKLQNLEYLDISSSKVCELPTEILKLQKLRSLRVYQGGNYPSRMIAGVRVPSQLGGLLSIQHLGLINADSNKIIVREIGKLTQLKALGITNLRREDGKELCLSLERLTYLQYLCVFSIDKDEVIDLDHPFSSSLQFLERIILGGRLEKMPQWIPSLQGLNRITLFWSELMDDVFVCLHHLSNLVELSLYLVYVQGEGLCFEARGFPRLKLLELCDVGRLRWLKMEEFAMPNLQRLHLIRLRLVEEIPCGIQHLVQLEHLALDDMDENLIAKLLKRDNNIEDYRRISHIPEVRIGFWKDSGWTTQYL